MNSNPRPTLLKQLRALGYQVALREDNRFFDIYQDQAGESTLHRLTYPEAKQLVAQPVHPIKLRDYAYPVGTVALYLFPEPAKQGALL